MKDNFGKPYKRKMGISRVDKEINKNLGHSFYIKNKKVIYIGKQEKTYHLTTNKEYTIIETKDVKSNKDDKLEQDIKKMYPNDSNYLIFPYETNIVIINDLGHKRNYPHNMFILSDIIK